MDGRPLRAQASDTEPNAERTSTVRKPKFRRYPQVEGDRGCGLYGARHGRISAQVAFRVRNRKEAPNLAVRRLLSLRLMPQSQQSIASAQQAATALQHAAAAFATAPGSAA